MLGGSRAEGTAGRAGIRFALTIAGVLVVSDA